VAVHGGRRTRAAATRGILAGGAWWPINRLGRMGRLGRTRGGAGPNRDGGGRGDLMASLGGGSAQKQHRLSLSSI
jgi:hypothetical protein